MRSFLQPDELTFGPVEGPDRSVTSSANDDVVARGWVARTCSLYSTKPLGFFWCRDGSLPLCFADGELVVGDHDVLVGEVGGCPFHIDGRQFELWKHTELVLDVSPGEPEGFSLPAGECGHFVVRSRVFSEEERAALGDR